MMTSSNTFFGTTPEAFLERARVARVCKRFWDQPNILMPAKYLECRAKDHPEPSHYENVDFAKHVSLEIQLSQFAVVA